MVEHDPPQDNPRPQPPSSTTTGQPQPKAPTPGSLPPWRVLLHRDEDNTAAHVTGVIVLLTPLDEHAAKVKSHEARSAGVAVLMSTHRERAELYIQQFARHNVTVTAEPAEA